MSRAGLQRRSKLWGSGTSNEQENENDFAVGHSVARRSAVRVTCVGRQYLELPPALL